MNNSSSASGYQYKSFKQKESTVVETLHKKTYNATSRQINSSADFKSKQYLNRSNRSVEKDRLAQKKKIDSDNAMMNKLPATYEINGLTNLNNNVKRHKNHLQYNSKNEIYKNNTLQISSNNQINHLQQNQLQTEKQNVTSPKLQNKSKSVQLQVLLEKERPSTLSLIPQSQVSDQQISQGVKTQVNNTTNNVINNDMTLHSPYLNASQNQMPNSSRVQIDHLKQNILLQKKQSLQITKKHKSVISHDDQEVDPPPPKENTFTNSRTSNQISMLVSPLMKRQQSKNKLRNAGSLFSTLTNNTYSTEGNFNSRHPPNSVFQQLKQLNVNNQINQIQQQSMSIAETQSATNQSEGIQRNIKTFVRLRPCNEVETELTMKGVGATDAYLLDERTLGLSSYHKCFTFDRVFAMDTSQEVVHNECSMDLVEDVLNGFNGTIFAYGQSGSGKTYTMFGGRDYQVIPDTEGIIPRVAADVFATIYKQKEEQYQYYISCSMLEIYKEQLNDLLSTDKTDLKIIESPQRGVVVQGLTQISIADASEMLDVVDIGHRSRQVKATRINEYSSRSHTLFMLEVNTRNNLQEKKGLLNLIDLAGSEKIAKSQSEGLLFDEAVKINLSLCSLGNVIHALTSHADHIPFRDSKLTRILQESLGGNYKTNLIVTISPHSSNSDETISALKFASFAKNIKTRYRMNVKASPEASMAVLVQLRQELLESHNQVLRYKSLRKRLSNHLGMLGNNYTESYGQDSNGLLAKLVKESLQWANVASLLEIKKYMQAMLPITDNYLGNTAVLQNEKSQQMQGSSELDINLNNLNAVLSQHQQYSLSLSMNLNNPSQHCTLHNKMNQQQFQIQLQTLKSQLDEKALQQDQQSKMQLEEKEQRIQLMRQEMGVLRAELLQKEKQISAFKQERNKKELNAQKLEEEVKHGLFENRILNTQVNMLAQQVHDQNLAIDTYLKQIKNFNTNNANKDAQQLTIKQMALDLQFVGVNDSVLSSKDKESRSRITSINLIPETPPLKPLKEDSVLIKYTPVWQHSINLQKNTPFEYQQQLLSAQLINQQLERALVVLGVQQKMEEGKTKIRHSYVELQKRHIQALELALQKTEQSQELLQKRADEVELEQLTLSSMSMGEGNINNINMPSNMGGSNGFNAEQMNSNNTNIVFQRHPSSTAKVLKNANGPSVQQLRSSFLNAPDLQPLRQGQSQIQVSSQSKNQSSYVEQQQGKNAIEQQNKQINQNNQSSSNNSNEKNDQNQNQIQITQNKINQSKYSYYKRIITNPNNLNLLGNEMERMEKKVEVLMLKVDQEQHKAQKYYAVYVEAQNQNTQLRQLSEELERTIQKTISDFDLQWTNTVQQLRESYQQEVNRLNSVAILFDTTKRQVQAFKAFSISRDQFLASLPKEVFNPIQIQIQN